MSKYHIQDEAGIFIVNRTRSLKDWIDAVVSTGVGLFSAVATCFILQLLLNNFTLIVLLAALCFAFVAVIKLADGLARLFKATDAIIVVDFHQNSMSAKYPFLLSTTIQLDNIESLHLAGKIEHVRIARVGQRRVFCQLQVVLKDGTRKTILNVDPTHLFRLSDRQTDAEVYKAGSQLAKQIAAKIGVDYRWGGFQKATA